MSSNPIRLRYSGFIVFTTQLIGVITGLVFTLLLTRSMTVSEFGIWTNIFDYTPYFLLFNPIFPFWATRFAARRKGGTAKTSITGQLAAALIAVAAYVPVIFVVSNAIGTSQYLLIYWIAGFYILTYYLVAVFEAVLQAIRPHVTGYGFIIQEIVKVSVALILILGFNQIFLGAILALVLGPAIQILYYCYLLSDYFKEKVNWGYVKQWLKGSSVIAYSSLGTQIASFVFILLFLYGGSEARAYYQAALSFTTIVGYASSLSVALYPRLLSNAGSEQEIGLAFRTVMMLAIPLATITMAMSYSFLTVLNISFGVAWPILIALTVDTLIVLINTFYSSCLMGVEAFDAEGQISIRRLFHSKIFKVFSVPYIQAVISLPLTYLILTQFPSSDGLQSTVNVVAILIAVHLATFIGLYLSMRGTVRIPVAWVSIAKYVAAAMLMGLALYFLPTTTTLLSTIAKAAGGFGVYVAVLLLIDEQTRELVGLIWSEISGGVKRLIGRSENSGKNSSV